MTRHALRRLDPRPLQLARDEILCVACVRNERLRIPHFLDYHRRLGVHRFLIVDNDSSDGSADLLLREPDVHVFHTAESFAAARSGVHWLNELRGSVAPGHWTLTVDVDELLVYPACEDAGLERLAAYLGKRGEDAVLAFLLDMYSDGPIRDAVYVPGSAFVDTCAHFDGDGYERDQAHPIYGRVPIYGGPRRRVFWSMGGPHRPPPLLPKIPFVRWRSDLAYTASTHVLDGVRLSELSAALLHFKFFSDFAPHVSEEARRGEHWESAGEYAVYERVVRERPGLRLMYEGSVRYEGSRQLADLGLIHAPAGFPPDDAGDDASGPRTSRVQPDL
jgi:hypothetical protein